MTEYILALSTSSGVAQASLSSQGGALLFDFEIADYQQQSATLLPQLGSLLSHHQVNTKAIKALAVNIGPGGFTSLRTACGVAQGLSVAWGIRCLLLNSFEILLRQAQLDGHDLQGQGTALVDARLGEFYAGSLAVRGSLTETGRLYLLPANSQSCMPVLANEPWIIADQSCLPIMSGWGGLNRVESRITVEATASLAWDKFTAGELVDALDCQPLYIREKVADTTAERLAKRNGAV